MTENSVSLEDSEDLNAPNGSTSARPEPKDRKRILPMPIKRAEYELYQIFGPQTSAEKEGSARIRTPPNLSQVWEILAHIPTEGDASCSSGIIAITHQLRRIAPYAPYVANLLTTSDLATSPEHSTEQIELARWCCLSSILFGAPPIPSARPSDPTLLESRAPQPPIGDLETGIRDIPRSQWPSKSARKEKHVFSQSKKEQAELVAQCQRPYINIMRNAINAGSSNNEHDLEAAERRSRAYANMSETLVALDTGIQSLSVATKGKARGRSLQGVAIHERAVEPVIDLVAIFLTSNARGLAEIGAGRVESIPIGIARMPRILQRMTMRDIRQKLQDRLRPYGEKHHDTAINMLLGQCLLSDAAHSLMFRLNRITGSNTSGELVTLWELCSSLLRRDNQASEPRLSQVREFQTRWLSAFLSPVVANVALGDPEADKLKRIMGEIYAHLPRPTPLPVYHALLSLYAGVTPSPTDGQAITMSSEASLANLIATWSRMRGEKVTPDLKAYMLLITGLGKKGDYQGLQQIWEELTQDAECKALWQEEEQSCESSVFPGIRGILTACHRQRQPIPR